jgi:hypothetical protein
VDSTSEDEWKQKDDVDGVNAHEITDDTVTVGFFVKKTDDSITTTSTTCSEAYCMIMTIPNICVKSIKVIK